jgi:hypothetical protein
MPPDATDLSALGAAGTMSVVAACISTESVGTP